MPVRVVGDESILHARLALRAIVSVIRHSRLPLLIRIVSTARAKPARTSLPTTLITGRGQQDVHQEGKDAPLNAGLFPDSSLQEDVTAQVHFGTYRLRKSRPGDAWCIDM